MKQKLDAVSGDIDLELIQDKSTEEIQRYGESLNELYQIYKALGLVYPIESHTNYRDSWFHYRKLCKKKDVISIMNEKYGLEEHLLRAVKDAQICLLQQLGDWLETWCRFDDFMICDNNEVEEHKSLYTDLKGNWVMEIDVLSSGNDVLFANACLYYFINHIYSKELKNYLQKLIHSIKELIFELRSSGVNIVRPSDHVSYVRECILVYNNMCSSLKETGMLYLLSSTGVILAQCGKCAGRKRRIPVGDSEKRSE